LHIGINLFKIKLSYLVFFRNLPEKLKGANIEFQSLSTNFSLEAELGGELANYHLISLSVNLKDQVLPIPRSKLYSTQYLI